MKKNLLTLFASSIVLLPVFSEAKDFVINQTTTGFTQFTDAKDKNNLYDFDIYFYKASAEARARLGNTGADSIYYLNSMSFKSSGSVTVGETTYECTAPSQWDLFGTFNIDIAASTSNKTIIDNQTGKNLKLQDGTINITNSGTNNTKAVIEIGSSAFNFLGGSNGQTPDLNVKTNTVVNGTGTLTFSHRSNLKITNNSTLEVNSKFESIGKAGNEINSQITVESGSTLKLLNGSSTNTINKIDLYGTLIADYTNDSNILRISGEFNAKKDSVVNVKGVTYIWGDSTDSTKGTYAKLTIDADSSSFYLNNSNDCILFRGVGGELVLNKENAITGKSSDGISIATYTGSEQNIIRINASQKFAFINASNADFDIYLADNETVTLTSAFQANNGVIKIHGFEDNRINVLNEITDLSKVFEVYQTINGEEILVDINTLKVSDGWLVTVPEPAEWAAIFGAIALGLAIYRRRK